MRNYVKSILKSGADSTLLNVSALKAASVTRINTSAYLDYPIYARTALFPNNGNVRNGISNGSTTKRLFVKSLHVSAKTRTGIDEAGLHFMIEIGRFTSNGFTDTNTPYDSEADADTTTYNQSATTLTVFHRAYLMFDHAATISTSEFGCDFNINFTHLFGKPLTLPVRNEAYPAHGICYVITRLGADKPLTGASTFIYEKEI